MVRKELVTKTKIGNTELSWTVPAVLLLAMIVAAVVIGFASFGIGYIQQIPQYKTFSAVNQNMTGTTTWVNNNTTEVITRTFLNNTQNTNYVLYTVLPLFAIIGGYVFIGYEITKFIAWVSYRCIGEENFAFKTKKIHKYIVCKVEDCGYKTPIDNSRMYRHMKDKHTAKE